MLQEQITPTLRDKHTVQHRSCLPRAMRPPLSKAVTLGNCRANSPQFCVSAAPRRISVGAVSVSTDVGAPSPRLTRENRSHETDVVVIGSG